MDSTLLYADSLLRQQPNTRFVVVNAPNSRSPLNSPRSPPGSPTKSHFDFSTSTTTIEANKKAKRHISLKDLIMKRKIFSKLFSALKDVTGSGNKTYPRDYRAKHANAKRRRARSSQCSSLSTFEPMLATIVEETESDLASVQSTIHRHYSVYGTIINQHQFVDAAA